MRSVSSPWLSKSLSSLTEKNCCQLSISFIQSCIDRTRTLYSVLRNCFFFFCIIYNFTPICDIVCAAFCLGSAAVFICCCFFLNLFWHVSKKILKFKNGGYKRFYTDGEKAIRLSFHTQRCKRESYVRNNCNYNP